MASMMEEALKVLDEEGFSLPDDVIAMLTDVGRKSRMPEDRYGSLPGSLKGLKLSESEKWRTVHTDVEGRGKPTREYSRSGSDSRTQYRDTDRGVTNESGYDSQFSGIPRMSRSSDNRHSYGPDSLPYRVSYPPSESGFSDRSDYLRRQDSSSSAANYGADGRNFRQNQFERGESTDSTSTSSTVKEAQTGSKYSQNQAAASDSGIGSTVYPSDSNSTLNQYGFDIAEGLSQDARVQNLRNNNKDMANKLSEQFGQNWPQQQSPASVGRQDSTTSTQTHSVGASSSMEAKQDLKKETAGGVEAQTAEKKYTDESQTDFTKTNRVTEHEGATEKELSLAKKDSSKTFSSEMDTKCYSKQDDNSISQGSSTTSKQDSGYFATDSQLNTSEITTKDGRKLKRQESVSSTASSAAMSQAKVSEEQTVSKKLDPSGRALEDVSKVSKQESSTSQSSSSSTSKVVQETGSSGNSSGVCALPGSNAFQLTRQDSTSSAQSSKTLKEESFQESKTSASKQGNSAMNVSSTTSSSKTSNQQKSETKTEESSVTNSRGRLGSSSSAVSSSTIKKQDSFEEKKSKSVTSSSANTSSNVLQQQHDVAPVPHYRAPLNTEVPNRYVSNDLPSPRTPDSPYSNVGYFSSEDRRPGRLSSQSSNLSRQDSYASSIDSSASAMHRRVGSINERQSSFEDNVFDPSRRVSMDSVTKLKEVAALPYSRSDSDHLPYRPSTRKENFSTSERSLDDDNRYSSTSRSKHMQDYDDTVGNYSSRTLPTRRSDTSHKYASPYTKAYGSQDDLQGITTKRVSQVTSNRRATLHDGVYLTEKEIFEARQDVRKLISKDGDAFITTKDSTRNETTIGKGAGGIYKSNTNENRTDTVTKEFLKMDEDLLGGYNKRGSGYQAVGDNRHGHGNTNSSYRGNRRPMTADISDRDLRESLLRESALNKSAAAFNDSTYSTKSDLRDDVSRSSYRKVGSSSYNQNLSAGTRFMSDSLDDESRSRSLPPKPDPLTEDVSEKIRRQRNTTGNKYTRFTDDFSNSDVSYLSSRSRDIGSRAGKSMEPDINASISASRDASDTTGEQFDYKNVIRDQVDSRRTAAGARRQGEAEFNMHDRPGTQRGSLSPDVGSKTGSYDDFRCRSFPDVKKGETNLQDGRQEPKFTFKQDDGAPWNKRRERIDTALSWIRSELGMLRAQDKVLMSQFQRCQDSIEQLKKQRPWYDAFSDDEDEDGKHWEDWEIEDFDRACQSEKREYFSKSQLDPKSGNLVTTQKQKMTLHSTDVQKI